MTDVHGRVGDLAGDMRQRFRLLNDRGGGIERRVVAQAAQAGIIVCPGSHDGEGTEGV